MLIYAFLMKTLIIMAQSFVHSREKCFFSLNIFCLLFGSNADAILINFRNRDEMARIPVEDWKKTTSLFVDD